MDVKLAYIMSTTVSALYETDETRFELPWPSLARLCTGSVPRERERDYRAPDRMRQCAGLVHQLAATCHGIMRNDQKQIGSLRSRLALLGHG